MADVHDLRAARKPSAAPSDLEAEHSVLGALMYDSGLLDRVSDILAPEMFFWPLNGRIFQAVSEQVGRGGRADVTTVAHALSRDADLAQCGGRVYLADLVEKSDGHHALRDHANIIREMWQRWQLINIGEDLSTAAKSGDLAAGLIEAAEKALLALQTSSRSLALVTAEEAVARVQDQLENPAKAFGIKLGLSPIDEVTGGFMPGELWLTAGRPGMGKSAIGSTGSLNILRLGRTHDGQPLGVIEICSEMTVEQMMRRHISDLAFETHGARAPTYSAIRQRTLTGEQRGMVTTAAADIRARGNLRMLYRTGLTVAALRSLIRRQIASWGRQDVEVGLVTVDHVGLLRSSGNTRGRTEAQGEIAREMKEMAGELNIPILAMVQLNRQVEARDDRRPQLSDLRDSGEWEENADGVIGTYRDAYYALKQVAPKRADEKIAWEERCRSKTIEAMFLKIREGEMQTVRLWGDMGHNAIRGHAPDSHYDAPLMNALNPDAKYAPFEPTAFD